MKVRTILAKKGMNVITITPEKEIRQAISVLAKNNIGALVAMNFKGIYAAIHFVEDILGERNRTAARPVQAKLPPDCRDFGGRDSPVE